MRIRVDAIDFGGLVRAAADIGADPPAAISPVQPTDADHEYEPDATPSPTPANERRIRLPARRRLPAADPA